MYKIIILLDTLRPGDPEPPEKTGGTHPKAIKLRISCPIGLIVDTSVPTLTEIADLVMLIGQRVHQILTHLLIPLEITHMFFEFMNFPV